MWHWAIVLYYADGSTMTSTHADYLDALRHMLEIQNQNLKNAIAWELKNVQSWTA